MHFLFGGSPEEAAFSSPDIGPEYLHDMKRRATYVKDVHEVRVGLENYFKQNQHQELGGQQLQSRFGELVNVVTSISKLEIHSSQLLRKQVFCGVVEPFNNFSIPVIDFLVLRHMQIGKSWRTIKGGRV